MTSLSRKTRVISLRLSQHEFEALKALHAAHGARSISEFARTAMQSAIAGPRNDNYFSLELKVQEINGKITLLDSEIARLSALIESELQRRNGGPHEKS